MRNRSKSIIKIIPTIVVSAALVIGAFLKISGLHPMLPHFTEMGLLKYLPLLGTAEIIIVILFIMPRTMKIGLLLSACYFGAAIAVEIPYHMMVAPAVALALVCIAAYIRNPSVFFEKNNNIISTL